jgi:hypothetical protein
LEPINLREIFLWSATHQGNPKDDIGYNYQRTDGARRSSRQSGYSPTPQEESAILREARKNKLKKNFACAVRPRIISIFCFRKTIKGHCCGSRAAHGATEAI